MKHITLRRRLDLHALTVRALTTVAGGDVVVDPHPWTQTAEPSVCHVACLPPKTEGPISTKP